MKERLNKFMARCGVAARRKCDAMIASGRVKVNGEVVLDPGRRIEPGKDVVEVDGKEIVPQKPVYIALYKPVGYLSTMSDPFGRPTIRELIKDVKERVFPVGRLDSDSEGLLLLTNDGDLANVLSHPRYGKVKVYEVKVRGRPSRERLDILERGIPMDGEITAPSKIEEIGEDTQGNAILRVFIREGRKRQIRRMMGFIGHEVLRLKRVSIGPISLNGLEPGEYRYLTEEEVEILKEQGSTIG
jgi:23S rRNA pseudouridine2605 synthase/16S rRNA pseudouridine516 synthase